MRGIILLSAIALVNGGIIDHTADGCPRDYSLEKLLPHQDCAQYYQCLNGIRIIRICPAGLYFDSTREVCDWPQNTDCYNKIQDSIDKKADMIEDLDTSDPSQAPNICATINSNGILVAHENCNKFYKCSYSEPVALKCPKTLLYNTNDKICDWPKNVKCGSRIILEADDSENDTESEDIENDDTNNNIYDNPNDALVICETEGSDGKLIAHEICNQFYKCSQGIPVALKCPLNLLYNPPKEYCDWPENVDCGSRKIPETDTGDDNTNNDSNINENTDDESSDYINNNINSDPSKAPIICAAQGSDGLLVAHDNCNQFYKCFNSQPVAMVCGLNLLYNPNLKYCDWPQDVDCGNRVIPEPKDDNSEVNDQENGESGSQELPEEDINDDPMKAPEICAAEGSDGVLVAHENCNQFYKCFNRQPVAMLCGLNLLYNPSLKYCDWPQDVDCGDRVIPEPNDDSGEVNDQENGEGGSQELPEENINDDPMKAPEICAAEDSDGVLVAHKNCNQFYKCFNDQPVAMLCGLNLLYNPNLKYCDWPQNVDCGDRVIPEPDDVSEVNDQENGVSGGQELPEEDINDDPSKAMEICATEGSDGVLVAHEICNKFYKCSMGLPVALVCYGNLLYNPGKRYCDWPQNVDCDERSLNEEDSVNKNEVTRDNDDKTNFDVEAASICAILNSHGTLLPHENCDQFYKCTFGVPVTVSCPVGLVYNPEVEVCDWPTSVECSKRTKRLETRKRYLKANKAYKFLMKIF